MNKHRGNNKIIYFDKETISNMLQQFDDGVKFIQTGTTTSSNVRGEIDSSVKVNLSIPFWEKLSFLFTGKLSTSYLWQKDNTTTITSTEISEFKKLKPLLKHFESRQVDDIENSSTFFRVAGGYLKMIKGGIEDVDIREFKDVMDSYEGYDTYKVSNKEYVRFNNTAFISNYKRNDLLTTKMDLYCVPVGLFNENKFDFFEQISKMELLITNNNQPQTLSDLYPLESNISNEDNKVEEDLSACSDDHINKINLYDVVYAAIPVGGSNE